MNGYDLDDDSTICRGCRCRTGSDPRADLCDHCCGECDHYSEPTEDEAEGVEGVPV